MSLPSANSLGVVLAASIVYPAMVGDTTLANVVGFDQAKSLNLALLMSIWLATS